MDSVQLTEAEILNCAVVGTLRQMKALKAGYSPHWGDPELGWYNNFRGCMAEMAVGKRLGIYWHPSVGQIQNPDIGPFEVRFNSYHKDPYLRLSDRDKPNSKYILVTATVGLPLVFYLHGWKMGRDGMLQEYKDNPLNQKTCKDPKNYSYWIPPAKLNSMGDIYD